MTIFLTILKTIGIILLVLLCLILALIFLVLFVPVRYRAEGSYKDEQPDIRAKASWLLSILSVKVTYQKEIDLKLCLFGISIPIEKLKKAKENVESEAASEINEAAKEIVSENQNETAKETVHETQSETIADTVTETKNETSEETVTDAGNSDGEKVPFPEKIKRAVLNLIEKIQSIIQKLKSLYANIEYYLNILKMPETAALASKAFELLKKILLHIMPKKLFAHCIIGTGDPAGTGQILAIQGILYPILEDKVVIVPDFDEKRTEVDFSLKGRIIIFTLAICLLRILFDKNLRKLVKLLKQGGAQNG